MIYEYGLYIMEKYTIPASVTIFVSILAVFLLTVGVTIPVTVVPF